MTVPSKPDADLAERLSDRLIDVFIGVVARISQQTSCSLRSSYLYCQRITLRHPKMGHAIQRSGAEKEFRRLLGKLA